MSEKGRPPGTREKILKNLGGCGEPFLGRMVEAIMNGDFYDECPLKAAGFTVERFCGLGTVILGPDGKCICTTSRMCMNVDKHDGLRCTRQQLQKLSDEAVRRRAWQMGGDE